MQVAHEGLTKGLHWVHWEMHQVSHGWVLITQWVEKKSSGLPNKKRKVLRLKVVDWDSHMAESTGVDMELLQVPGKNQKFPEWEQWLWMISHSLEDMVGELV